MVDLCGFHVGKYTIHGWYGSLLPPFKSGETFRQGFLLKSPVLTIVGSLIGFSGAILTKIMCTGGGWVLVAMHWLITFLMGTYKFLFIG